MQLLRIRGGQPLCGCVPISGAKNAALPVLAATVLFRQPCRIENCPRLTDVAAALEILRALGAQCSAAGHTVTVDPRPISSNRIPRELAQRMRGSVFFLGPLMARFHSAAFTWPGGCPLGKRPLDFHLAGLEAMGAKLQDGVLTAEGGLQGAHIRLPYPSVGATENLVMAAVGAKGETVIENAAREPEIGCLCAFLRSGGCHIRGDGTGTLHIRGGLPNSGSIRLIPDRMEAATYLCAVAGAGGCVKLTNVCPAHLESVLRILRRAGCDVQTGSRCIALRSVGLHAPGTVVTGPYPAFPTDAQAPMMAALLRAKGEFTVRETVFEDRMHHVPMLKAMGADITCAADAARIRGVEQLHGAAVEAADLRGGAALVVAALAAGGETEIRGLGHLRRGYEDLPQKLRALGAQVVLY